MALFGFGKPKVAEDGKTVVVNQLIMTLRNPKDIEARCTAAKTLGNLSDPRAVEPLIAALLVSDDYLRACAVRALGKIRDARAVEPLIAILNSDEYNDYLRACAAEELGNIGDVRAIEPLITGLKEYSDIDRKDDEGGIGSDTDSRRRRRSCAEALGKFGNQAVAPLITVLKNSDNQVDVQKNTIQTLGEIGDARAVEPLIVALGDSNDLVNYAAFQALVKIGSPAVDPLIVSLKNSNQNVRRGSAAALGAIGDVRAFDPFIAALEDCRSDQNVRISAAYGLGKIGDTRALDALITALKDSNMILRMTAADALGRLGDIRAIDPLTAALEDPQLDVQVRVNSALYELSRER